MPLYDVFLSHASADKPAVEHLAHKLKAAGLDLSPSWRSSGSSIRSMSRSSPRGSSTSLCSEGHPGHGRIQSGRTRRSQSASIIEPVRIEGDAVASEQEDELVARASIPVVNLLVLDIPPCPLSG